jgi:hypothetical protein
MSVNKKMLQKVILKKVLKVHRFIGVQNMMLILVRWLIVIFVS